MAIAYLGLGANLGNRLFQLNAAITRLSEIAGNISAISDFYETASWGFESPHQFLNAVIQIETSLSPYELLTTTQQIEYRLGRISKSRNLQYADRTIDIDILMYDNLILQTLDLVLPHPLMHKRLFVLQPLAEIAPNLIHPVFNKTITELTANIHYE